MTPAPSHLRRKPTVRDLAHLHTPADLHDEPTLEHPNGARETVAAMTCDARVLSIALATLGYLAPARLAPHDRVPLRPLPAAPCPSWCAGTGSSHRAEADRAGHPYRMHLRVLLADESTSLTITQTDRVKPHKPGPAHLSVLAEDLDSPAAMRLAAALMNATDLLAAQGGVR